MLGWLVILYIPLGILFAFLWSLIIAIMKETNVHFYLTIDEKKCVRVGAIIMYTWIIVVPIAILWYLSEEISQFVYDVAQKIIVRKDKN